MILTLPYYTYKKLNEMKLQVLTYLQDMSPLLRVQLLDQQHLCLVPTMVCNHIALFLFLVYPDLEFQVNFILLKLKFCVKEV